MRFEVSEFNRLWRDERLLELRYGRWGFWWTLSAIIGSLFIATVFFVGFLLILAHFGLENNDQRIEARQENLSVILGNPYSLQGFLFTGLTGISATWLAGRIQGMPGASFLQLYGCFSWTRFWRMGVAWILTGLPLIAFSVFVFGEHREWSFLALQFPLFVVTAILLIAIQTFAEEAFFRGYLYHTWVRIFPFPALVAVFWSAVFTAMHWWNPDFQRDPIPAIIGLMSFALFAQWLTVRTGSLDAAWGMHFANNVFAFLFVNVKPGYITDAPFLQYNDSVLMNGGSYIADPIFYAGMLLNTTLVFWAVLDRRSPFFLERRIRGDE